MINVKNMKELIEIFEKSTLSKMEYTEKDTKIYLEKAVAGSAPIMTIAKPVEASKDIKIEKEVETGYWVNAPLVGTYYHTRTPGGAPLVEIGKHVHKGDVLCIIEAMKVMNEIHSPVDGIVKEMPLNQKSMVEFDQKLIRIEVDA